MWSGKLIENKSREKFKQHAQKCGRYAVMRHIQSDIKLSRSFFRVLKVNCQIISKFYYRFPFTRLEKEISWFKRQYNLAAVSFTDTQKDWISLPLHFIAQWLASHYEACFQPPLSKGHGGNLARTETCSGDSSRSSRRAALKGEPGCAGRASLSKRLHAGPVYWKPWQQDHFYELLCPDIRGNREGILQLICKAMADLFDCLMYYN